MSKEEYKIRRRGSVVLANSTVYDTSISYAALGVLAVLLARPDDAPKGYRTLMRSEASVGQASILSAFRELRVAGYRYQFYRTENTLRGNRVYTCTYIYEEPVSLEMAKRDHFNETGCDPIEVPDRRKGARVPDAQEADAQEPDAQAPDAQRPSSASVGFSPTNAEIDQREPRAEEPEKAAEPTVPAQSTEQHRDDAASRLYGITAEQAQRNTKGAALARAALRGDLLAASLHEQPATQAAVDNKGTSTK